MKEYILVRSAYIKNHMETILVQPERRLNALSAIESIVQTHAPDLFSGDNLFKKYDKNSFAEQYFQWKGKPLSGAEKSVIVGLFKFSR